MPTLSAAAAERWAMATIALLVAGMTFWFGAGMLNRGMETRLVKEVLFEWHRLGQGFDARGGPWPDFTGSNHVAYMRELLTRMHRQGLISAGQAAALSFSPRLERMGSPDESLFLLLLPGRLVIFGLSAQSFDRIDGHIDAASGPARGSFTGRPSADGHHMIGYWQL